MLNPDLGNWRQKGRIEGMSFKDETTASSDDSRRMALLALVKTGQ